MKRMMRTLKKYKPTAFKAKDSYYDQDAADFAVAFIENLCHTKGTWAGKPFELCAPHRMVERKPVTKKDCRPGAAFFVIKFHFSSSKIIPERRIRLRKDSTIVRGTMSRSSGEGK